MPDLDTPVSSLPSRPIKLEEELAQLEESERFEAIIHAEGTMELDEPFLYVYDLVFITKESVSAVSHIEDDETWYRIFKQDRSNAELTDAYDAVREIRDVNSLFDRHPLTIEEAVFTEDTPSKEETSGYEEGDSFECPVCGDTHTVKLEEDKQMKEHSTDVSFLYVECPEVRNDKLTIEYQARTPR